MSLPNPPDWPECHHEATEDGSEGKRLDCTHSGVEMVDLLCDLCEGQARNLLCHCLHLTPGSADPFKSAIFDQCYQTLHNRPFSHSPPKAYSIIRFLETQLERVSRTLVIKAPLVAWSSHVPRLKAGLFHKGPYNLRKIMG